MQMVLWLTGATPRGCRHCTSEAYDDGQRVPDSRNGGVKVGSQLTEGRPLAGSLELQQNTARR